MLLKFRFFIFIRLLFGARILDSRSIDLKPIAS